MPPVPTRFSISNRPATVPVRKSSQGPSSIVIGADSCIDSQGASWMQTKVDLDRYSASKPPLVAQNLTAFRQQGQTKPVFSEYDPALGGGTRKEYSNQTFQYAQKDTFSCHSENPSRSPWVGLSSPSVCCRHSPLPRNRASPCGTGGLRPLVKRARPARGLLLTGLSPRLAGIACATPPPRPPSRGRRQVFPA